MTRERRRGGFTLVEVMVAVLILGVSLAGVMTAYSAAYGLSETSLRRTQAMDAAIAIAEEIRQMAPSTIPARYANDDDGEPHFVLDALAESAGTVAVDTSSADYLEITISVCWRQQGGRVFGEDANLDGVLSGPEDGNLNGQIDSPAMLSFRVIR